MTVSVLVPAYNEAAVLPRTLAVLRESLRVFEAKGWATDLVVCDNNSTDQTAAIAAAAGARVVFEPVNQIARARNRAASVARGDWFVFVDADSEPSPALFADVAAAIESGRVAAGGATVTMDDRRLWARLGVGTWNLISRTMRWAAGSFVFVDADVFRAVGGFSEALYASEEIDLSRRLKRRARASGRRLVILRRHPLHTSARKLRLYSWWEITRFMARTVLTGGRTLTRADDCFVWYDGRR